LLKLIVMEIIIKPRKFEGKTDIYDVKALQEKIPFIIYQETDVS
jgi:hypothetical protein